MRRFTSLTIIVAAVLGLVACQPSNPAIKTPDKTSDTGTTGSTTPETKQEVPANLKHEGYQYYGLDVKSEQTYDFDLNGSKRQGMQKETYLGLSDGKPRFSIERAEALSNLGTDVVEVRDDGVYMISSREQTLETPMLALPAKMEIGKSWEITEKLKDINGNEVTLKASNKIDGQEKVTTSAGTFDCLAVSMTGTLVTQGKTQKVTGKTWYAAGTGTVKLTVSTNGADGKPTNYTITLSKPSGDTKASPSE
ncbi:MAG: hypothetical protein ACKVQS_06800 [Fimbriimonadaceae bacterium]